MVSQPDTYVNSLGGGGAVVTQPGRPDTYIFNFGNGDRCIESPQFNLKSNDDDDGQ